MFRKKDDNQPRKVVHSDTEQRTSSYSYYANRSKKNEQKNREKQLIEQRPTDTKSLFWNHVVTVLILLIIVPGATDLLWLNSTPKVVELKSSIKSSVLLQSNSTYQKEAETLLNSSIFNHDKITVNVGGITSSLENKFPELSNVSITLPLSGHTITIYVQPAQPALILSTGAQGPSYLLNSNGTVISTVNSTDQKSLASLNLPSIQYPNYRAQIDHKALSSIDVTFITYIFNELEAQHVNVNIMNLQGANRELDVFIAGVPYFVKFNLQASSKEQAGALIDVRQYLAQNKVTPSQYIDVRIPGRAYYK